MQMYIVLAITALMIAMFLSNKLPFGLVTMTCCVLLVVTGVTDISTAFSGFSNKVVILLAPMMALSAAITKTSVVPAIRAALGRFKSKNGMLLILFFYLIVIAFVQFIPATATFTILIVFFAAMDSDGEITPARMLLPMLGISCIWKFRLPIGMGATTFAQMNAMCEGIYTDESRLLQLMDVFKVALIPTVILTVYCLFAWKLLPAGGTLEAGNTAQGTNMKREPLPRNKEILVYVVFVAVMITLMLNAVLKDFIYITPAIGVLILVFAGVLKVPETVHAMMSDITWMIAGMLAISAALGSSGAGQMIGNALLHAFGDHPSSFVVMLVFTFTVVFMTNLMSNTATITILTPVAAMICEAGGWDVRGLLCVLAIGYTFAIAFPSGATETAIIYAAGKYSPAKMLKFTLPYLILGILSLAFSANLIFPLYG